MFREMRRIDRQADTKTINDLLEEGEYGVLSTFGSNNYPYAVPVSYVHLNNKIYFHCAMEGQKLDNIAHNSNVCFCVVGKTKLLPKDFSTEYESIIIYGKAKTIVDKDEREAALVQLIKKYSPDYVEEGIAYIKRAQNATNIVVIEIERITGKKRGE